jgi:hypothetical protein
MVESEASSPPPIQPQPVANLRSLLIEKGWRTGLPEGQLKLSLVLGFLLFRINEVGEAKAK